MPQDIAGPQSQAVDNAFLQYQNIRNNTKNKWYLDPCLRRNVWHCLGLCGVTFMNGYDGSLMNGLQPLDEWQNFLDHPKGYRLGAISACLFIPAIVFSWVAESIAKRWGRRPVVWVGVIVVIGGIMVNSAAVNFAMYCGGRAVIGVGSALCLTTAPTLLQEISHPRYRATIAGFYTCVYYIASIISSWVCFAGLYIQGEYSWRLPSYMQLVGPAFVLIATFNCPESPRWLISKGLKEKGLQVLADQHANGELEDDLVQHQFREIQAALEMEESQGEASYRSFLKTKPNRRRLLILIVVGVGTNWVGNGIINYYLTPTLNQVGIDSSLQISLINAGLQIWNLIISSGAALLSERLGRRFLWLASNCGMFLSYIFAMALSGAYASSGRSSLGLAVIPFLFLFFGSYDVAWTPLQYAYPVECLPFFMRMKGMALFILTQNVAVTVNTFINPIALDALGWKYYGVYLVILAMFIVVTYFYFPETKGLTIEEIGEVFDKLDSTHGASSVRWNAYSRGKADDETAVRVEHAE